MKTKRTPFPALFVAGAGAPGRNRFGGIPRWDFPNDGLSATQWRGDFVAVRKARGSLSGKPS